MKHLGDITKIDGHNVPLVDIVCGGSPCQDLSVAGLRKGLQHSDLGDGETTRSGLFMEQIRIIKEMRDESTKQLYMRGADVDRRCIQPRFMVWENVPGAFSSNKGQDFRAVLEETAKIVCEDAIIPMPQKWTPSGCIMGDGWSIAWRVHDAQFWGVPQRRKRIALVADFGGSSAPEILFERKSVSGDSEQSREERETIPGVTVSDTSETISFQERAGYGTTQDKLNVITYRKQGHPQNAQQGQGWQETNINDTLNAFDSGETRTPTLVLENHPQDSRLKIKEDGIFQTMGARGGMEYEPHTLMVLENNMDAIVRRLTPLECERLQGYPDGWTDIGEWVDSKGKKHKDSDSPRYKALGNSIALSFWEWMAERMLKELGKEHPTMASLFDGIGGFPLVYSRHGCIPVWASEIEEFPIAVTKIHFKE